MCPVVDLEHVLHGELGVALRGGQALMSEHFLDGAQVGAFGQQVRGEGVAQRVGAHFDIHFRAKSPDVTFENAINGARGEPLAVNIEEERSTAGASFVQQVCARIGVRLRS